MSFEIIKPKTVSSALEKLSNSGEDAKILAGGSAVVLMLQQKLIAPEVLISLQDVEELNYIKEENGNIKIGALTTLREIEQSSLIQEKFPALSAACGDVGNVRIRNQATIGGNVAEADYASDPPTVLHALDATISISSSSENKSAQIGNFYLGFYTTILESYEIITEIVIPIKDDSTFMNYLKFKSRSSEDRPCVGVSSVATFSEDKCVSLAISVGAACENPTRLTEFESMSNGQILSDELIEKIATGYAANIDTIEDLRGSAWYRTQMIKTHIKRSLEALRNDNR